MIPIAQAEAPIYEFTPYNYEEWGTKYFGGVKTIFNGYPVEYGYDCSVGMRASSTCEIIIIYQNEKIIKQNDQIIKLLEQLNDNRQ